MVWWQILFYAWAQTIAVKIGQQLPKLSYSKCYRGTVFFGLPVSRARCNECIYKVEQQHNLGDVANSIPRLCVYILDSHNSERIIKIDPRFTELC